MNGMLIVDKPEGLSSAEVVRRVKGRRPVKVGHLGTLDPFATGVLPLCIGEATKIAQFLSSADKRYEGIIRLGVATDSGDRTGSVTETAPVPALDESSLRGVEAHFAGAYRQKPPMYSALKRAGVPLYKLARRGIEVDRNEREVEIRAIHLEGLGEERLRFDVTCSKGTYIRVLAEDLGSRLGTLAHVESLRRVRFGPFDLRRAVGVAPLAAFEESAFISIRQALEHLPAHRLSHDAAKAARRGQAWVLDQVAGEASAEVAILVDPDDCLAAVVVRRAGRWQFGRVLNAG
jgi:tRNA pseudouridine55 synthase